MRIVKASAPGKIVILGEFAVLADAPAISMAIDRRASVSIEEHTKGRHLLQTSGYLKGQWEFRTNKTGKIEWINVKPDKSIVFLFECFWYRANVKTNNYFKFILDTSMFYDIKNKIKYGIGSSSALIVAMAAAFVSIFKIPKEIANLAHEVHFEFQKGAGSGVDVQTAIDGGIIEFYRNKNYISRYKEFPNNLLFNIFWCGTPVCTQSQLKSLDKLSKRSFLDLCNFSKKISLNWGRNNNKTFFENFDSYIDLLKRFSDDYDLNLFANNHNDLVEITKMQKDIVYKPCGAGGDIGICIGSSKWKMDNFNESAQRKGFKLLGMNLEKSGLLIKEEF